MSQTPDLDELKARLIAAIERGGPPIILPPREEVVTEHAQLLSGGGFHVWDTGPDMEEVYPLKRRIKAGQRFGQVYRRRVIVVEDWTEVPRDGDCPSVP